MDTAGVEALLDGLSDTPNKQSDLERRRKRDDEYEPRAVGGITFGVVCCLDEGRLGRGTSPSTRRECGGAERDGERSGCMREGSERLALPAHMHA